MLRNVCRNGILLFKDSRVLSTNVLTPSSRVVFKRAASNGAQSSSVADDAKAGAEQQKPDDNRPPSVKVRQAERSFLSSFWEMLKANIQINGCIFILSILVCQFTQFHVCRVRNTTCCWISVNRGQFNVNGPLFSPKYIPSTANCSIWRKHKCVISFQYNAYMCMSSATCFIKLYHIF